MGGNSSDFCHQNLLYVPISSCACCSAKFKLQGKVRQSVEQSYDSSRQRDKDHRTKIKSHREQERVKVIVT